MPLRRPAPAARRPTPSCAISATTFTSSSSNCIWQSSKNGSDWDVAALHVWRNEVFGKDAIAMRKGELAIALEKGEAVIVSMEAEQ